MDVKKFQNVEDLNPVIGISENTLRGCKSANVASVYGCSNPCSFRDMTFFKDFFETFQKTR